MVHACETSVQRIARKSCALCIEPLSSCLDGTAAYTRAQHQLTMSYGAHMAVQDCMAVLYLVQQIATNLDTFNCNSMAWHGMAWVL